MKVSRREENTFCGNYYGYHDEMDAKKAPLSFKLVFALAILVVPIGVCIAFYGFSQEDTRLAVMAILVALAVEFPLIHLLMVLFDRAKYGKARKECKVIGSILSATGVLVLVGAILSCFIHFAIVIATEVVVVFLGVGVGLCIVGARGVRREKANCTLPVWAVCSGYETLNPHISLLDEENNTHAQNQVVARTDVYRPVWEYQYEGAIVHATPEVYEGRKRYIEGKQYKLFINPSNPKETYCKDNSNAVGLLWIGKIWLAISIFMILITVGALFIVMKTGAM